MFWYGKPKKTNRSYFWNSRWTSCPGTRCKFNWILSRSNHRVLPKLDNDRWHNYNFRNSLIKSGAIILPEAKMELVFISLYQKDHLHIKFSLIFLFVKPSFGVYSTQVFTLGMISEKGCILFMATRFLRFLRLHCSWDIFSGRIPIQVVWRKIFS